MAKMFYTLEEVCEKLGKSEEEVKNMASSGQLQEFRDRDKLMFKVDQIDLLAGGDEDTGEVSLNLEDTSGSSGLDLKADSGGLDLSDSREGSGISVFDTQVDSPAIEAGDTQEGDAIDDDLTLEAVGSGSGLLDLTRESDDTSLGAELLEEVYSSDENIEIPANASGLFEAAGADSGGNQMGGVATVPMVVETYDGAGSGLGVGLMLGALVSLIVTGIIVVVASMGATPDLAIRFSDQLMVWGGGLLGATILFGLIGMLIGKASG